MSSFNRRRPDWNTIGRDWPNRDASRFVKVGPLCWHVQIMGEETAPKLLLVHGTGASTHSFRGLMPILAQDHHVLAMDLPGHGFTDSPYEDGLSLPGMSSGVAELLKALEFDPVVSVGHSAGAAILCQMAYDGQFEFDSIVALNGALEPMHGFSLFSPLARLLFLNPLVPKLLSLRARTGDVTNMVLSGTGSQVDEVGKALYRRLFESSAHVSGALGMMANWDLRGFETMLPNLDVPLVLVFAEDDRTVPSSVSRRAAQLLPNSRLVSFKTGGHLLHEVNPQAVSEIILQEIATPIPAKVQAAR